MNTILSYNDILPFGKYENQKVSDIIERDPDYIMWLYENT
jgi:uncharacterized protein (DUF3820 family)